MSLMNLYLISIQRAYVGPLYVPLMDPASALLEEDNDTDKDDNLHNKQDKEQRVEPSLNYVNE